MDDPKGGQNPNPGMPSDQGGQTPGGDQGGQPMGPEPVAPTDDSGQGGQMPPAGGTGGV